MSFPSVCTRFIRLPASLGIEGSCARVSAKILSISASTRFISSSNPASGGFCGEPFGDEKLWEMTNRPSMSAQITNDVMRVILLSILPYDLSPPVKSSVRDDSFAFYRLIGQILQLVGRLREGN